MTVDLADPDLVISLRLGPDAPRAARYHVAQVDRPSPDLRDAVVLLTSELVTRAARQCQSAAGEAVELRVWMPADIVRVELKAPRELLSLPLDAGGPHYDLQLLDQVADRWSVDTAQLLASIWFEIDRHRPPVEPEPEPEVSGTRRDAIPRPRSFMRRRRRAAAAGRHARRE